jgi:tRNA (cmo5U34)-methyltransferase
MFLERWPRARIDLVDLSPAMLDRARTRFAGRERQVRIRTADYLRDPLGGPYDAVVSALSIHHLADQEKRAVFRRSFAALRPGGWFVDADNVLAPTPALAAADRAAWIARVRRSGIAPAELRAALRRTRLDVLAPLPEQLRWLRAAGFTDVDCRYKWLHFAVFGGRRPRVRSASGARPRP